MSTRIPLTVDAAAEDLLESLEVLDLALEGASKRVAVYFDQEDERAGLETLVPVHRLVADCQTHANNLLGLLRAARREGESAPETRHGNDA